VYRKNGRKNAEALHVSETVMFQKFSSRR
jgi:hypothetical protein